MPLKIRSYIVATYLILHNMYYEQRRYKMRQKNKLAAIITEGE
jgi:hypothetical protein